ncbi:MAG: prepilin-type N-terminal cleavage/methylation domain-containing protein [Myxococcota bacterium]
MRGLRTDFAFSRRRIVAGRRGSRKRTEGMTLIEILIVVALLALMATGIGLGFSALHRTKLRSSALDIVGAARFAYHRAVTRGKTVRIVFDLDAHTIAVEEAHGRITLNASEDRELDEDEDNAAVDPWEAARARLDDAYGANLGRAAFEPVKGSNGSPIRRYTPHQLPITESRDVGDELSEGAEAAAALGQRASVRIARLITPHEMDPREQGRGYIYFFPGGRSEHATVQITDSNGESVYSVEIHPLTGQGRVHNYAYEPEELTDEGSEVRDPG